MRESVPVSNINEFLTYIKKYDKRIAIRYEDEKVKHEISYSEVVKNIETIGSYLLQIYSDEKNIAIISDNTYENLICTLAIIYAGKTAVMLSDRLSTNDIAKLCRQTDTKCIIKNSSKEICDFDINEIINIEELWEKGKTVYSISVATVSKEDDAMIFFTSGTTGGMKAVTLTQENILVYCQDTYFDSILFSHPKCTHLLPRSHVFGFSIMMIGLYYGVENSLNIEMKYLLKDIQEFKPDILVVVPAMLESLGKVIDRIEQNIKCIVCGGAFLQANIKKKFIEKGIAIYEGYGLTETSTYVFVNTDIDMREGSVGKKAKYIQSRIVDHEIQVKGPVVMKGYYNDADASAKVFDGEWFKTGDLGYIDEDGFLHITGRKKNLIILSNGENICPEEIEDALLTSQLIDEVIIKQDDNVLMAEVYSKSLKDNYDELYKMIKSEIDTYNRTHDRSRYIHKLELRTKEFEKTSTMKIKR